VVLECLDLHARHRLHVILRLLLIEPGNLVVHETGEFHVERRITFADGFDDALQVILVQLCQFGETIVREQIRKFLGLARVVLIIHRHLLRAHEQRGFQPSMTAHDQAAAFAYRDRPPPALLLNDGSEKLDLMCAMPVRVHRVRLERRRIDEGIVGAVDLHSAHLVSKAGLTPQPADSHCL
jgi:hypothetical protein